MDLKAPPWWINGPPDSLYDTSSLPDDWTDAMIKALIEQREKGWRDHISQLSEARKEGIARGITESIMDDMLKAVMIAVHKALEKGKMEENVFLLKMEQDKEEEIASINAENKQLRAQIAQLQAKSGSPAAL